MDTFTRISVQKAHEIIATGTAVTIVDIRDASVICPRAYCAGSNGE